VTEKGLYAWVVTNYIHHTNNLIFLESDPFSNELTKTVKVIHTASFTQVIAQGSPFKVEYALENYTPYGQSPTRYKFLSCQFHGECATHAAITESSINLDHLMVTDPTGIAITIKKQSRVWSRGKDQTTWQPLLDGIDIETQACSTYIPSKSAEPELMYSLDNLIFKRNVYLYQGQTRQEMGKEIVVRKSQGKILAIRANPYTEDMFYLTNKQEIKENNNSNKLFLNRNKKTDVLSGKRIIQ
jgi:hypothetical protein